MQQKVKLIKIFILGVNRPRVAENSVCDIGGWQRELTLGDIRRGPQQRLWRPGCRGGAPPSPEGCRGARPRRRWLCGASSWRCSCMRATRACDGRCKGMSHQTRRTRAHGPPGTNPWCSLSAHRENCDRCLLLCDGDVGENQFHILVGNNGRGSVVVAHGRGDHDGERVRRRREGQWRSVRWRHWEGSSRGFGG